MAVINFEFKAKVDNLEMLEDRLQQWQPEFIGEDRQTDTYFHVRTGRLKLREGNIENALIHYERADVAGAKQSTVLLYQHQPDPSLRDILTRALGVKIVVDKSRRIYFVGNVKIHFDTVAGLGKFVEVEAIDRDGQIGLARLQEQCRQFAELFELQPANFIATSYSDMM